MNNQQIVTSSTSLKDLLQSSNTDVSTIAKIVKKCDGLSKLAEGSIRKKKKKRNNSEYLVT